MAEKFDIAIIGAGMAGASLGAQLAGKARIVLLEAEDTPGYHATGRSAAFWTESYGGPGVQPLTAASGRYLREGGFMTPRRALTIGRAGQEDAVARFAKRFSALGVTTNIVDRAGVEDHIPGILPDWTSGALEPSCCDIDVAGLHQHYLKLSRNGGVELRMRARLDNASRDDRGWQLSFANGNTLRCEVLVNAAGAWADDVAQASGLRALGIQPLRRTIAQLQVSPPVPADLPLVLDIDERFYFKQDAGRVWVSPHDETPSPPCDAAPEEVDVATAIDRFQSVVNWRVDRVEHSWAGLRSFAPDRLPVYGFDTSDPRFFWFAGQGGFGIQTAPAAAQLAAEMLLDDNAGSIDGGQIDPERYRPQRFEL